MKAEPLQKATDHPGYTRCQPSDATHIRLNCPGPFPNRILPIKNNTPPNWAWNGDTEKPTITPSILTTVNYNDKNIVCHSFVTNGKIQFLSDSTHEFSGQTVDLLEID